MKNVLEEEFGREKMWVNWKLEKRHGKATKVPYDPHTRRMASSTNENTWGTYTEAVTRSENVGIVFRQDRMTLGVDIDHCLDGETVEIKHTEKKAIKAFIAAADTYGEISPSKTGLHFVFRLSEPLKLEANRHGNFEAYTESRYFTVTNYPYGKVKDVRTITPEEATQLLKILGYPWAHEEKPPLAKKVDGTPPHPILLTDEQVLERLFSARRIGDQAKRLYGGDKSGYGDDASRADMALCNMLAFWTGRNAEQIERLWLNSPLGKREKSQNRKDYVDRTINKAIAECKKVYRPKNEEKTAEESPLPKRPRIHQFDKPDSEMDFDQWMKVIQTNFPDLAFPSEVSASVASQLLIKDITNPSTAIFVDVPSSGKTIELNIFEIEEIAYASDKFSPASLVSNSANVKKEDLPKIDLLPRIQYRVLLVRDFATLFSKREEDLKELLGVLTRVLDGEGLSTDTGVHGQRQYGGEYLFMLLAASTPIPPKVMKIMGNLGSRLFFLKMHSRDKTDDELISQNRNTAYKDKEKECRAATGQFLRSLWYRHRDGIVWDKASDAENALRVIARCSRMLAKLRGVVNVWSDDFDNTYAYTTPVIEKPDRINQLFYNMARGHAVTKGRTHITEDDLKVVIELTLDSAPTSRADLVEKILAYGGVMKTSDIERELNCSKPTALKEMETLRILGVCSMHQSSDGSVGGQEKEISLTDVFKWLCSSECSALRGRSESIKQI